MIVISDTTPVISLLEAGKLNLLHQLYSSILIPSAVYSELTSNTNFKVEASQIDKCSFISVMDVENTSSVNILRNVTGLDAGESESIVLYEEQNADLLLMDELKGRRVAKQMNIRHIGTAGILMLAYDKKILKSSEVAECLDTMLKCHIRLSERLCNKVMEYIGLPPKY